jgi:glycerol kinase
MSPTRFFGRACSGAVSGALDAAKLSASASAGIGLTNQRETTWGPRHGQSVPRAISLAGSANGFALRGTESSRSNNPSRTLLIDPTSRTWSQELRTLFDIPSSVPER